MYLASVVAILCSVIALTLSCCTPDQWEAQEGVLGGYADRRHHGLIKDYIFAAYDAVNKRTAAFLEYRSGEHSKKFHIVTKEDKGQRRLYVVDLKDGKCWSKKLERPFRKACIPPKAKSVGSYYLGPEGGFKVTGYEFEGREVKAFVSVQETGNDQCIPVYEAVYGRLNKVDLIQTVGFINVRPGIKNETVFDVPKDCKKEDDYSMAEEFSREHFILAI